MEGIFYYTEFYSGENQYGTRGCPSETDFGSIEDARFAALKENPLRYEILASCENKEGQRPLGGFPGLKVIERLENGVLEHA